MKDKKPFCYLCKTKKAEHFYSELNLNLYRCNDCGLVFVHPLLKDKDYIDNLEINYIDLASKYSGGRSSRQKESIRSRKKWEKKRSEVYNKDIITLRKYLKGKSPKGLELLDIGCGEGGFLMEASKHGFICQGLEPSKSHFPDAKSGLKVYAGFLKDFRPRKKFDVITMLDVLEHTKDPLGELRLARRLIKDMGILMLRVPNLRWLLMKKRIFSMINLLTGKKAVEINPQGIFSPHTHFYNFTEQNLERLLRMAEFRTVAVKIINASKSQNTIKNTFYAVYYVFARLLCYITGINLAISLNMIATPRKS